MIYFLFPLLFSRDALDSALFRRNLSFSQITISDNNFPSSMDVGMHDLYEILLQV